MLNRVSNVFVDSDREAGSGTRPWQVDGHPNVRLFWLGLVFVLPLVAVVLRAAQVQSVLEGSIVARYEQTTDAYEAVPSRDGRILSADGRVLAYDVERFDVHAHYRWLEDPADVNWLRQRALSQLSRGDRRDRAQVARAESAALSQRDDVWNRLARLSDVRDEELSQSRREIQRRVERIVAGVEQKRRQNQTLSAESETAGRAPPADVTSGGWWPTVWSTLVATLTTPPRRGASEPVVVREELDHHLLLENVSRGVASEIAAHPESFPDLRIQVSTRRTYPARDVAAHVVGNRLLVRDDQLKRRASRFPTGDPLDYRRGDRIGRTGVEKSYDRFLRGLRGRRRITRNRGGEIVEAHVIRPPQVGRDVVLTLHLPLQERAEQILDEAIRAGEDAADESDAQPSSRGGAIVVLDVHSGAVLAAAAAPRFDLNLLVDPDPERWREVNGDPRRPFFARATKMTLPPGSVFKTLTSIALMESGRFDPDAKVFCRGFLDNPNRYRCYVYRHFGVGHAEMDLTDALARSCNVYFFSAARRLGPEPMIQWARRFGFGQATGIDLPGERGGNLPVPPDLAPRKDGASSSQGDVPSERRKPWYPGDTLGLAIGQSRLTATPLQIARMMAIVANGGYLITPHVVRDFGPSFDDEIVFGDDVDDRVELPARPQPARMPGLSEATLARVREGLEKVVSDPRGTGYKRVRMKQIAIAGKTGTAEAGGGRGDHAWFAGYAPADGPRVAFVVVLEHAGSGGKVAGPAARKLIESMLELGVLEPTRTADREGTGPN